MAFVFKLNNYLPNDGPLILYEWKEFMKMLPPDGPGWQVSSSSDGISFSSNSDIIVSSGFDAGGISNEYSWFVITAPSGRQLVFQLTSEPSNFFIGYSKSGAYTGGSTTTRPTATDECILLNNGGFLAASGFETSAYPKCIVHFGADTSGANSFYILPITTFTSSKVESGGLFMDEINPVDKSNTNIDPVIFYIPSTSSFTDNYSFDSFGQNSRDISTFSPKIITKIMEGTYLESFSLINGMRFYDYHYALPGLMGKDIYSNKILASGIIYGMSSGSYTFGFVKGIGKNILTIGIKLPMGTIVNVTDMGTFAVVRDFLFPIPSSSSFLT